jgi:hypothetical protein
MAATTAGGTMEPDEVPLAGSAGRAAAETGTDERVATACDASGGAAGNQTPGAFAMRFVRAVRAWGSASSHR